MENEYDLLVIGTGSAGTSAAMECANAGWRVAIADERPFGGTCLLRGCDPKKVLVGAAELEDWARRMRDSGVVTGALHVDWPGLMRFKRTFTDPAPAQREHEYKEAGITSLHGTAQFISPRNVRIGKVETAPRHIVSCLRRETHFARPARRASAQDQRRLSFDGNAAQAHRAGRRRLYRF